MTTAEFDSQKPQLSAAAFAETLPVSYRQRFTPAEIAAHAHVAHSRPRGQVAAGKFPSRSADLTGICVSAEDRPGLLALLTSALSELSFDVVEAEAFSRNTEPVEALDVFYVRDPSGKVTTEDAETFAKIVNQLLSGERLPRALPLASGKKSSEGTTVRFREDADGWLSVLEIETADRSGLLFSITRTLAAANVQITASRVSTKGERVYDSFTIEELDGSPISQERRFEIQIAVLAAIEEGTPPSS